MHISVSGTVFSSKRVEPFFLSKKEIKNEQIDFKTAINKTNKNENIIYQTTNKNKNSSDVLFKDNENNKYIIVNLENKTISRLKNKFGYYTVQENNQGLIRLTGLAESFVSSWFKDIAYDREFLSADKNSDGILDDNEYRDTKNEFGIIGIIELTIKDGAFDLKIHEEVAGTYGMREEGERLIYRTNNQAKSLDDELNHTLQIDKNFDKVITLEEAYKGESSLFFKVMDNIEEFYGKENNETPDISIFLLDGILVAIFKKIKEASEKKFLEDKLITSREMKNIFSNIKLNEEQKNQQIEGTKYTISDLLTLDEIENNTIFDLVQNLKRKKTEDTYYNFLETDIYSSMSWKEKIDKLKNKINEDERLSKK